jgi:DNA-binding NarL/FixJ family response regulator
MADHAAALAADRSEGLGDAAARLAAMGALLWAAEAAFAAAEAARREGDPRAAAAWSRRATDWRDACEAAATPGLVADLAPVPLTQREREVALLASQGLASREIGERLFVSRRTVESHLARVYDKLGIRSRYQLADLLTTEGTDPVGPNA